MNNLAGVLRNWGHNQITEVIKVNNTNRATCLLFTFADETKYLLKSVRNEEKLLLEEDMLIFLIDRGITVSPPLRTKDNSLCVQYQNNKFCLYKYISGDHLQFKTREQITYAGKKLGCILAKLHSALKSYDIEETITVDMDLHNQIFNCAIPNIKNAYPDMSLHSLIEARKNTLATTFRYLPKQFIHRDFHPNNVLFNNGFFAGIIDFELCTKGYRTFDIGYLLTSLLSEYFEYDDYKNNWLTAARIIVSSYNAVNVIAKEERKALFQMLISIQLIFISYCIDINNMQQANKNLDMLHWFVDNEQLVTDLLVKN